MHHKMKIKDKDKDKESKASTPTLGEGQTLDALLLQRQAFDNHDLMDDSKRGRTAVGRAVVSMNIELLLRSTAN